MDGRQTVPPPSESDDQEPPPKTSQPVATNEQSNPTIVVTSSPIKKKVLMSIDHSKLDAIPDRENGVPDKQQQREEQNDTTHSFLNGSASSSPNLGSSLSNALSDVRSATSQDTNGPANISGPVNGVKDEKDNEPGTPSTSSRKRKRGSPSQNELKNLKEDLTPKLLNPTGDDSALKSRSGRVLKAKALPSTKKRHSSAASSERSLANGSTPAKESKAKAEPTPGKTARPRSSTPAVISPVVIHNPPPLRVVTFPSGTVIKQTRAQTIENRPDKEPGAEFQVGDIIWSKLTGFPFWPALITTDPLEETYAKKDAATDEWSYHVQYFGEETTRGWTKPKNILRFEGRDKFLELIESAKQQAQQQPQTPTTPASGKKGRKGGHRKQQTNKYSIEPSYRKNWEMAVGEAVFASKITKVKDRLEMFTFNYKVVDGNDLKVAAVTSSSAKKRKSETPAASFAKKKKVKRTTSSPEDVYEFDEFEEEETPPIASLHESPLRLKSTRRQGDFNVFKDREMPKLRRENEQLSQTECEAILKQRWEYLGDDQRAIYYVREEDRKDSIKKPPPAKIDEEDDSLNLKPIKRFSFGKSTKKIEPIQPKTPASLRPEKKSTSSKATPSTPSFSTTTSTLSSKKAETKKNDWRVVDKEQLAPVSKDTPVTPTRKSERRAATTPKSPPKQPTPSPSRKSSASSLSSATQVQPAATTGRKTSKQESSDRESQTSEEPAKSSEPSEVSESDITSQSGESEAGDTAEVGKPPVIPEQACFKCIERVEPTTPNGEPDVVTCSGPCLRTFHRECATSPKNPVGSLDAETNTFKCTECSTGKYPCFICSKVELTPEGTDGQSIATVKCSKPECGRFYHIKCLAPLPHATFPSYPHTIKESSGELICPLHACLTCHTEHQEDKVYRTVKKPLLVCLKCPTAFHFSDDCIAAGSNFVASDKFVVCPEHLRKKPINFPTCFACMQGGDLICCERCPAVFHKECLDYSISDDDNTPFICASCIQRKPLRYGDLVWVKYANWRWWPGKITGPMKTPDNIMAQKRETGQFPVMFFGERDEYAWFDKSRVFPYVEGDSTLPQQKGGDRKFKIALQKAKDEFEKYKAERFAALQRKALKPPPYNKIKTNKPIGKVKLKDPDEHDGGQKCDCKPIEQNPCSSDDCSNRSMCYECNDKNCNVGEKCQNRRFQKKQYVKSKRFNTLNKGWALRAGEDIEKGRFVIEYVGEVIDEDECQRRLKEKVEKGDPCFYFLTIDKDRIIDAGPSGNDARFMNHSCDANCEMRKWTVNGQTRIGLFAVRNIGNGEELTFNYNLETRGDEKTACHCGADICSGFIGVRPKMKSAPPTQATSKGVKGGKGKNGTASTSRRRSQKSTPARRRSIQKNHDDFCFQCGSGGELVLCDQKDCPRSYHKECVNLPVVPKQRWICPWHHCDAENCGKPSTQLCSDCPASLCDEHKSTIQYVTKENGKLQCPDHEDASAPEVAKEKDVESKSTVEENEVDMIQNDSDKMDLGADDVL